VAYLLLHIRAREEKRKREPRTMTTAIGYIRVSTEEQSKEGVSLEMQAAKIRAYAELNDLNLIDVVADAGISAKDIKGRPGFQEALEMVYSGKADALVVWKLDRAFRSTQDALTVAGNLNKKGRALISINEKLDTTTAVGEFFFTLMASLAQMERKVIGERTSAALATMKSRGQKTGGSCPYGYDVDGNGRLVPRADEQHVIARIQELKADGFSLRRIVAALATEKITNRKGGTFAKTQIERVLRMAA
jgi:site-specific DNA recombinase